MLIFQPTNFIPEVSPKKKNFIPEESIVVGHSESGAVEGGLCLTNLNYACVDLWSKTKKIIYITLEESNILKIYKR